MRVCVVSEISEMKGENILSPKQCKRENGKKRIQKKEKEHHHSCDCRGSKKTTTGF